MDNHLPPPRDRCRYGRLRPRFTLRTLLAWTAIIAGVLALCLRFGSTVESLAAALVVLSGFLVAHLLLSTRTNTWALLFAFHCTAISYSFLAAAIVFAYTQPITVREGGVLPLVVIGFVWSRYFSVFAVTTISATIATLWQSLGQCMGRVLLAMQFPGIAVCLFVAYALVMR